ncbi:MAG: glucose-1-phosphate adenylyltransferase subunit GlgD [Clostridia bacterium]|nr:glucose-1-phosphate adenylyltransferase subunit GlgD [Clostridia bacterium]
MNALGLVFSNIHDNNVPELTQERTMGSIPFLGRYRLIDFALSNLVNSGVAKVGLITKSNYQSLMDHVGSGKDWDLARRRGGLHILPPFGLKDNVLYSTRLEALRGAKNFLARSDEEYVVMTDCDNVCVMNFDKILTEHKAKNADITLVYVKKDANDVKDVLSKMIVSTADNGRVTDISFAPRVQGEINLYTNVCILKRTLLQTLIADAFSHGYNHFGKDVLVRNVNSLRIFAHEHKGYFVALNSLQSYYKESLKFLDKSVRDEIFKKVDVYTKVKDSAPTRYGASAVVKNSLIADGCVIEGTVENSIIFRGVKIGRGTVVKNSILMQGTITGENVSLNSIVADKNVVIKDRRVLSACESLPFYISKNIIV